MKRESVLHEVNTTLAQTARSSQNHRYIPRQEGDKKEHKTMASIIPVPVIVSVGIKTGMGADGVTRNFGAFRIVPYVSNRNGSLEIDSWYLVDPDGDTVDLNDRFVFNIMPRKMLDTICQLTFESDRPDVPMVITIDDQTWTYPMRAREIEYEQVHYEIEIEGDWMRLTEAYVGDLLDEEHFMFAERELLPTIDFGNVSAVMDEMN